MQTSYITALGGILLAGIAPTEIRSQTLHHRLAPASGTTAPAQPDARQALPLAAEGEYRWGEAGEVIELYVEGSTLRGYMTRRSERRDTGSAPMTFAFTKTGTTDATLSFTTRQIHGESYSFAGRAVRGPAATRSSEGYYLLIGTLTLHQGQGDQAARDTPVTRQVSLKLAASSHHPV